MSQAGTLGGGDVNPREPLTISGDTGIATFASNNVRIYAATSARGAGSTVSFNNSGSTSVFNLTDAIGNTILGDGAGSTSISGGLNVGMGFNSMRSLTTGENNVSIGSYSSNHLTTGSNNTAVGYNAFYDLITGNNNIAIGVSAGQNYDGSESYNIDIGSDGESGVSHTTTIGFTNALFGQTRCFIGGIVGNTLTGAQTVVIDPLTDQLGVITGGSPAIETITGNDSIAVPPVSNNFNFLTANSTVKFAGTTATETLNFALTNLVLGSSLPSLTSGANNVGLGSGILGTVTSGSSNVGIGTLALQSITTGSSNVVIGFGAGRFITIGGGNMLFGTSAGASITAGNNNTAIGTSSLGSYTTGAANAGSNIAIGASSLANLSTGISNIAFGASSGSAYIAAESSNILFSNTGVAAESNTIRIGTEGTSAGQQNKAFVAGVTSSTVGGSAPVGVDTNGQLSSLGFGTTGQVFKSNGAASSPTWQVESSYALNVITTGLNSPADSTTYGMANQLAWVVGLTSSTLRYYIPKAGTISACSGAITATTIQGSAENVTVGLRLNGTTDYTITTTLQMTAVINPFSNLALNIPVAAGDYVVFYVTTPAWATNPTNCGFSATFFAS